MTKSKIIDRDLGYKDIMKRLKGLDGEHIVEVGVPATAGQYEDGANQVLVASVNEFGSSDGRIPERSFLRSTVDENTTKYADLLSRLIGEAVDGRLTIEQALDRLGLKAVADVQRKIVQLDDPPNAEATIERKRSSNPLIDTGQLRQSIIHRVNKPDE